jgi:hypothetical protein
LHSCSSLRYRRASREKDVILLGHITRDHLTNRTFSFVRSSHARVRQLDRHIIANSICCRRRRGQRDASSSSPILFLSLMHLTPMDIDHLPQHVTHHLQIKYKRKKILSLTSLYLTGPCPLCLCLSICLSESSINESGHYPISCSHECVCICLCYERSDLFTR